MSSPLFTAAPSMQSASARAWFFDETATVVGQVLADEMNLTVARYLAGPLQLEIQSRYTAKGIKVRYVHDWRSCRGYTSEARDALIQWGRNGNAGTNETIIAIDLNASPFLKIGLSTATMIMRRLGMKLSIVNEFVPGAAPFSLVGVNGGQSLGNPAVIQTHTL